MLQPSKNTTVYEASTSQYWFEDDIVFVISKKGVPDPKVQAKEFAEFKDLLKGKKVYGVMDVSDASSTPKETRDRNSAQLPSLFHAIAFIVKNPMTRMLAHLYMGMKPLQLPVKMCSNENEAIEWIKAQKENAVK